MAVSEPGVVTAWPSTETITSPGLRPWVCAAVPHTTPRISAPLPTGAILVGTPAHWAPVTQASPPRAMPPGPSPDRRAAAACCPGFALLLCATCTPRKPGRPMYTVELDS